MPRISSFAAAAASAAADQVHGTGTTSSSSRPSDDRIAIIAVHALDGYEIRVHLPRHARFKHIKKAIVKATGSNNFLEKGQLVRKDSGLYRAYKDNDPVGEVRRVLMACLDLAPGSMPPTEAALDDGDVSAAEESVPQRPAARRGTSDTEAPDVPARGAVPPGSRLTRSRALALQRELLEGFQHPDFQRELEVLRSRHGDSAARFTQERQELMLTVQSAVLPRYGFEGTHEGVFKMMGEWGPFLKDPEFIQLTEEIHQLLGIDLPPEAWERTINNFKRASTEQERPKAQQAARQAQPPASKASAKGPSTANRREASNAQAFVAAWRGPQPFRLFIAGSWNGYRPEEMSFEGGFFVFPVVLGRGGSETFQLLKDGNWGLTIYPSCEDANPYDQRQEYRLCGPDGRGHGKNWHINRGGLEGAKPGVQYVVVVALSAQGQVGVVHWQPM